ncbi:MAG: division/cell wall cluster transcriptional repressor MraZ [Gammaproteobacteria bacterium]|nr:division/cell wall cluster transcriptional repressor MraZ [Gammaproteobacteria bacterium]
MFAGSHQLSVDDKGRIAIPARFRQALQEQGGVQLYITLGSNPCLELYPAAEFRRIAADIQNLADQQAAEQLKQWFIGFAVEAEMDRQGRVLLAPMLRRRARLDGSAVLVGQITRFDLWAESAWNERFGAEVGSLPAELAAAFRAIRR